ncbi:MAG: TRAP transporter substrate-binding protein [Hydrogenophaga sp.]|jgi:TRAP-type C4-dicarboxylate transport system substrate-binding protein|uniref:TRAP transporter substrate-binding protein n=1 Tax=Hydrogenophaga sp. TaxID=1904254 RepID=UPI000EBE0285|nr:TRAP transporter substrate-binding protein [Hydrogenophaga sp.]MDX9968644.1 TRAP transporter substrate-binding protein [Hydrogenophaga sp.]HAJ11182.1 C4-dicarboxylate ABC transporter [Comamonadaceae bacterium]
MIQRRTLLKTGAAIAVGSPALVGFAQQSVTLKFHTFMAPQSHVYLNMHKAWMDKVTKDSGGRIKFEGYPAMQLGGGPPQLYDQAKDGVADIIWTLPGYTAGRFPRAEVFELPFIMNNADATSRAYWEYIHTVAQDEFKDVQTLALHVHGPGVFHMRDKLVRTADDLRGVKMRGPTRQATKLLGYLGATPVGMPLPQIPDALSKGVINGCTIPWEVVPSVKVQELTKHHSEFAPSVGALYTSVFIMAMNKAKYQSLPPDLKAIIDANSGMETSAWLGRVQQEGDIPGRESAAKRGNEIHVISGEEAKSFTSKAQLVEQEWVQDLDKRGFNGKQLLDTAKSLIEKYGKKA